MSTVRTKPLGRKAYGSIGHLPCSRMGPTDSSVHHGQALICTDKKRDKHDRVWVQEKLDGSCCAVALIDGVLHPLGRAGWPAVSSRFEQHRMFDWWVRHNEDQFRRVLRDGERLVGEWLAQAHSTRYEIGIDEPFVAFDIMVGDKRLPFEDFRERVLGRFTMPHFLGEGPLPVHTALERAQIDNFHGAVEPIEGVMYRVERNGKVDFLAKYVRPEKADGIYLPEISGKPAIWNWTPPGWSVQSS